MNVSSTIKQLQEVEIESLAPKKKTKTVQIQSATLELWP